MAIEDQKFPDGKKKLTPLAASRMIEQAYRNIEHTNRFPGGARSVTNSVEPLGSGVNHAGMARWESTR